MAEVVPCILILSGLELCFFEWLLVLEMSSSESIRERLPECRLPSMMRGRLSNLRCERDSLRI
jgi:hypothetical protein